VEGTAAGLAAGCSGSIAGVEVLAEPVASEAAAGGAGAAAGFGAGGGGAAVAVGAGTALASEAPAEEAAGCSPASPITATTVLIATVCPSVTRISSRVPATGEGISASTLSVEISKIGSSRLTGSPTFFIHFVMVPSAMDSPICGMMTSVAICLLPTLRASFSE